MSAGARASRRREAALTLLSKVRQSPDLIGVVLLGEGLAYAYATRQTAPSEPEVCPTCEGRARVVFLVAPREWARGDGTVPRPVHLVCPLCEGTGRLEVDYANFVDFYTGALPQDTAHLVAEDGTVLPLNQARKGDWINRALAQELLESEA